MLARKSVIIFSIWLVMSGISTAFNSALAAEVGGYSQQRQPPTGQQPGVSAPMEPNAPAGLKLKPTSTTLLKPPEKLFSPSVSQLFYDIAYEITHGKDITESQAQQAIIFLNAANDLDTSAGFVSADILTIASRPGPARNLQILYNTLIKYVNKTADFQVATNAIRYLLQQLDTRQQKEVLLSRLIRDLGDSNLAIKSELITALGLLYAERADDANAARTMAIAYSNNKYNRLAFEKLVELVPEQIGPVLNLEYLRLRIRQNPFDLDYAVAFAQYAKRVQLYEVGYGAYEYCTDLFRFLYPNQNIPADIYLDWMTCCYNVSRSQPMCLQLAEQFRKQGQFDLQIETLAAKAAEKTGDLQLSAQILKNAEQKAIELLNKSNPSVDYKILAWFYSFALPDANKALDYGNKAYSAEPNSPLAAALLANAFADNNEPNLAKPLVETYSQTQIAAFVQAKLQLAEGQKQSAIETLRLVIDKDPGSIVAELARNELNRQQADYIPIFDTTLMLMTFRQKTGEQVVPQFVRPEQMLSLQLNVRGNRFSYGNDFSGVVSVTNNWFEPLVISDDGLCRGQVIIDAEVTGDLNRRFDKLIVASTRPTTPIDPGQNVLIPVRLFSGPLKTLLINHPQASLNIKFTAYLDPVIAPDGNIVSSIPGIKPVTAEIERPRVEITTEFLQNRFGSLSKGKQGQKIKAAQLFAGLLMEIREMDSLPAASQPPYKLVRGDWIAPMLKSGLLQSLGDSDWVVKVHALSAIMDLPLDYDFTIAASEGLNDKSWPAQMTALRLLAQKQGYGFTKVLDHYAQNDNSEFVKNMAVALGAKVPEPAQSPEQPLLDLLRQEPNTPGQSPLGF